MTKIRSFSGEFPRKILFPEIQTADPSFEKRLGVMEDESPEEQIEKILLCLLDSEYPYKDIKSAVLAINAIAKKEVKEEKDWTWKPKIWLEVAPGKFFIGERFNEKIYWGSNDYEE
jgi:hypothetical protein